MALLALMLLTAACSSATVNTDFDPAVNFANFHTYSWRKGTPATNPLMDQRIIASVDTQLQAKGFRRVDSGGDVFVTYHASIGHELDVQTVDYGGPYRCWGGCTQSTTVRPVKIGTLVVDLVDAKRNTLTWRGIASDAISSNPQETARKIDQVVGQMFQNYPPRA
jgi:hypothetical protein